MPSYAQQDGDAQPDLRGDQGEVAVDPVGQGAHRHHRHDLGEGEPQQHLVLGLHVGRYFVLSHPSPPIRRGFAGVLEGVVPPLVGSGTVGSTGLPTTAFITSSTTP